MFAGSTKSIIITSSRFKGLGARIGSIGYATSGQNLTFLTQSTQFINGLVASPIRITFIRYGYERERPKYEVKNIIGIVPIISELRKDSESETIIRTFTDKFPKTDFDSHLWLKTKLDLLGKTDNIDVCILAPVGTHRSDLRICSDMEFNAWFKSLMYKESIRRPIYNFVHDDVCIHKLPDEQLRDIASKLRIYFESGKGRDAFIDYILSNRPRREDLIKCISMIRQNHSNKAFASYRRSVLNLFSRNKLNFKRGSKIMGSLSCKLSERMFVDEIFYWKLRALTQSSIKNSKSIANKAKRTKEVIESMANEIDRE